MRAEVERGPPFSALLPRQASDAADDALRVRASRRTQPKDSRTNDCAESLGPQNILTLSCAGSCARILRCRGRLSEARYMLQDTLENMKHPATHSIIGATLLSILARVLKDQGLYRESEILARNVVDASHILLGPDDSLTYNVLSKIGRFGTVERIARRAFIGLGKQCGAFHPYTLRTAKRLGTYIRLQNRLEEAQPILENAQRAQKKIYIGYHPELLSTLSSLAMVYAGQGKLSDAHEILSKVLRKRRSTFGGEHPDTESTVGQLRDWATGCSYEFRQMPQNPSRPSPERQKSIVEQYDSSGYPKSMQFPEEMEVFNALRSGGQAVNDDEIKNIRHKPEAGKL